MGWWCAGGKRLKMVENKQKKEDKANDERKTDLEEYEEVRGGNEEVRGRNNEEIRQVAGMYVGGRNSMPKAGEHVRFLVRGEDWKDYENST